MALFYSFMAVILVSVFQLGCDVRTELKEMHDSTKKMEKHTSKMVEITEKMEKTTAQVNDSVEATNKEMVSTKEYIVSVDSKMGALAQDTEQMKSSISDLRTTAKGLDNKMQILHNLNSGINETYDGLRQGDSLSIRDKAFEGLISSRAFEKKMSHAAQYFGAFEYQLYNGLGLDSQEGRREKLTLLAVQQFFKDVYEVYNHDDSPMPLSDPEKDNTENLEASFNALALALHKDNPKQEEEINFLAKQDKSLNLQATHMLKLIKSALFSGAELKKGNVNLASISEIEREILNNEEVAIKLLQSRWTMLLTAALNKSVKFKEGGLMLAAWKLLRKWELNFALLNESKIEEQHLMLKKALETREFLKTIGVKTKTPLKLNWFIKRMNVTGYESLSQQSRPVAQEIVKLIDQLKE